MLYASRAARVAVAFDGRARGRRARALSWDRRAGSLSSRRISAARAPARWRRSKRRSRVGTAEARVPRAREFNATVPRRGRAARIRWFSEADSRRARRTGCSGAIPARRAAELCICAILAGRPRAPLQQQRNDSRVRQLLSRAQRAHVGRREALRPRVPRTAPLPNLIGRRSAWAPKGTARSWRPSAQRQSRPKAKLKGAP